MILKIMTKNVKKLIDKDPVKIMDQIIKLLNSDIEIGDMKQNLLIGEITKTFLLV